MNASAEVLTALFADMPQAVFIADHDGRIADGNSAVERLLSRPMAELLGQPWRSFFPVLPATNFEGAEVCFRGSNGADTVARLTSTSLPLGKRAYFLEPIAASPNGSAFLRVESALRESEQRFRQFAESLQDVIWIVDADTLAIVFINKAFERVWGHSRAALLARPNLWIECIHDEDRTQVEQHWRNVLAGRDAALDIEYRIVRTDGGVRWVHDSGVTQCDELGRIHRVSGVARDITDRKNMEQEKAIFEKQFLETQKLESLGVLAGGIAHDFNNLLAAILGNVNLAQTVTEPGSMLRGFLDQIETISLRASDLCKQMLAYAGKGRFVIAALDLNQLVEELSHLLNISISKKAALILQLDTPLPSVLGDASQLRQLLLNLVINASEALGDRTGVIRVVTGRTAMMSSDLASFQFGGEMPPGEYVFMEVRDNGPGMSAEVASRIFEPFFTTKFTGRGLGLAAVQGIVRSHQGGIRVLTRPDHGATFTILLRPSEEAAVIEPPLVGASSEQFGRGEVLIVDDEDILRTTLTHILQVLGFRVRVARNGREAIELFSQHQATLRLVLLDLTMPVLSGEEALRELRRINDSVPVVLMSGYMEQDMAGRFNKDEAAGFLPKPFRMEHLEGLLKEILNP